MKSGFAKIRYILLKATIPSPQYILLRHPYPPSLTGIYINTGNMQSARANPTPGLHSGSVCSNRPFRNTTIAIWWSLGAVAVVSPVCGLDKHVKECEVKCKYHWDIVQNKYENLMMLHIWILCGKDLFRMGIYRLIQTKTYFTVCISMYMKPGVPACM